MTTIVFYSIFAVILTFAAIIHGTSYFETKDERVRRLVKGWGSINLAVAAILGPLYLIGVIEIGVLDETGFAITILGLFGIFTYYLVRDSRQVVRAHYEVNTLPAVG